MEAQPCRTDGSISPRLFIRKIDIEQTDVNDIIMEVIGGMNLNDYNLRGNKILKTARIIIDIKIDIVKG